MNRLGNYSKRAIASCVVMSCLHVVPVFARLFTLGLALEEGPSLFVEARRTRSEDARPTIAVSGVVALAIAEHFSDIRQFWQVDRMYRCGVRRG